MLERMSGPLCDALLEQEQIAGSWSRSNTRVGSSSRWTTAGRGIATIISSRDMLRTRLARREPELIAGARPTRAAAWHEANGSPRRRDLLRPGSHRHRPSRPARRLPSPSPPTTADGVQPSASGSARFDDRSISTIRRIGPGRMDPCAGGRAPSWRCAGRRSDDDGRRPMPDGGASKAGWVAMMRVFIARGTTEQLQADAVASVEGILAAGPWSAVASFCAPIHTSSSARRAAPTRCSPRRWRPADAVGAFTGRVSRQPANAACRRCWGWCCRPRLADGARGGPVGRLGEYSTTAMVCAASARWRPRRATWCRRAGAGARREAAVDAHLRYALARRAHPDRARPGPVLLSDAAGGPQPPRRDRRDPAAPARASASSLRSTEALRRRVGMQADIRLILARPPPSCGSCRS